MKIMIVGVGRHGKDTVAELIEEFTGMKFASSSYVAAKHVIGAQLSTFYPGVWSDYSDGLIEADDLIPLIHSLRHHEGQRDRWRDAIAEFNRDDETRLARILYLTADVYVGCRRRKEFMAGREEGLFQLSIYVDASKRVQSDDETCEIGPDDCDIVIPNNLSEEDLRSRVERLCESWFAIPQEVF